MKEIELLQHRDPTLENLMNEKQLHTQLQEHLKRRDMIWQQKSREMWLKNGYANTKFFHLSTIIRRKHNSISAIKINRDQWLYNHDEISSYFIENFTSLFNTTNPQIPQDLEQLSQPIITEDNMFLKEISTTEEIESMIRNMDSMKSPGSDGMPALFYKEYWNIIKDDFIKAV